MLWTEDQPTFRHDIKRTPGNHARPLVVLSLLVLLGMVLPAAGQTVADRRVWSALAAQGVFGRHPSWRWSSDSTLRARDGARTLDFIAQRVVISRVMTRSSALSVGYSYGVGFPDSAETFDEHRLLQQFV